MLFIHYSHTKLFFLIKISHVKSLNKMLNIKKRNKGLFLIDIIGIDSKQKGNK